VEFILCSLFAVSPRHTLKEKRDNLIDMYFKSAYSSLSNLRRCYREDAALWRHRLPATKKDDVELWLACLAV
jgi:hypothetical protein